MYNANDIAILYLDWVDLTAKTCRNLLENLPSPSSIFDAGAEQKLAKLLPAKVLADLKFTTYEQIEEKVTAPLEKYGIHAVTFSSAEYPSILKNIADPPIVLYAIGNISLLKTQKIGIVGTRTPTNYGRDVANRFTKDLVNAGLTTVSGLSYGIDTCAAVSTLEAGGKHIAVLAGGLDSIYPAQNIDLSKKIVANGGLLISEHRPHIKPMKYAFIARNRIISGLSDGTLVVEAGKKSGATSTAMFAVEQGRELFVIPGNITSPMSAGTNELINEMPDCFTISSKQILDKLNISAKPQSKSAVQLDMFSQEIVNLLKNGELHFDEICNKLSSPANVVASTLSMLEIMGMVQKLSGNFYSLVY